MILANDGIGKMPRPKLRKVSGTLQVVMRRQRREFVVILKFLHFLLTGIGIQRHTECARNFKFRLGVCSFYI